MSEEAPEAPKVISLGTRKAYTPPTDETPAEPAGPEVDELALKLLEIATSNVKNGSLKHVSITGVFNDTPFAMRASHDEIVVIGLEKLSASLLDKMIDANLEGLQQQGSPDEDGNLHPDIDA